ncbi:hypothetical protein R3P38DRAFT_2862007 [Favolaschia claudopus]|uniref:F-box domain-containing protein n=1 Tax=Favolaschia claudopus TaxID=2862362 RepID=A0AAW0DDW4_9AGAR
MAAERFIRTTLLPSPAQKSQIRDATRSYAPPPQEIPDILSSIRPELARYDAEILRLKSELYTLEQERMQLQMYYDEANALSSPVRLVPSEILAAIFALQQPPTLETDPETGSTDNAMAILAQNHLLVLSRVCARWHDIVLGTPALWSNVELRFPLWDETPYEPTDFDKLMRVLGKVLERGRSIPLSVFINTGVITSYTPMLELLTAHSPRWESLRVHGPRVDLLELLAVRDRLPSLKAIDISGAVAPGSFSIFRDAPLLKSAKLDCSHDDWAQVPQIPLAQLRSLQLTDSYSDDPESPFPSFAIFPHLPPTIHLTLQINPQMDYEFNDRPTIRATSCDVASLTIELLDRCSSAHDYSTLYKALDSLTLPALTSLRLYSDPQPAPISWLPSDFLALSKRSSFSTHLQHLDLWHVEIPESELLEALAGLPALERLAIADWAPDILFGDSLLEALACVAEDEPQRLVPRLTALKVKTVMKFSDMVLLDFLRARLKCGGPFDIELFSLEGYGRELEASFLPGLDELDNLGFSLYPVEYL